MENLYTKITRELEQFHGELAKFKTTVAYLTSAKEIVGEAVETVNSAEVIFTDKLLNIRDIIEKFNAFSEAMQTILNAITSIDFPEKLKAVEGSVREVISELDSKVADIMGELKKELNVLGKVDFENRFSNLSLDIGKSIKASENVIDFIDKQRLSAKIRSIQKSLSEEIQTVNTSVGDNTKLVSEMREEMIALIETKFAETSTEIKGIIEEYRKMSAKNVKLLKDEIDDNRTKMDNIQTSIESELQNISHHIRQRHNFIIYVVVIILILTLIIWLR